MFDLKPSDPCFQRSNSSACDPWTARDFDTLLENASEGENQQCQHCLPDCQLATYTSSLTALPFRCLAVRIYTICRRCDSRNMNLSPFCTLNANSVLPKWQSAVNQTYGSSGDGLEYVSGLPSPIRREYKKPIMRKGEILSALSEVSPDLFLQ